MMLAVSLEANTAGWPSLVLTAPSSLPAENIAENISKCFNVLTKSVELLYFQTSYNYQMLECIIWIQMHEINAKRQKYLIHHILRSKYMAI